MRLQSAKQMQSTTSTHQRKTRECQGQHIRVLSNSVLGTFWRRGSQTSKLKAQVQMQEDTEAKRLGGRHTGKKGGRGSG